LNWIELNDIHKCVLCAHFLIHIYDFLRSRLTGYHRLLKTLFKTFRNYLICLYCIQKVSDYTREDSSSISKESETRLNCWIVLKLVFMYPSCCNLPICIWLVTASLYFTSSLIELGLGKTNWKSNFKYWAVIDWQTTARNISKFYQNISPIV